MKSQQARDGGRLEVCDTAGRRPALRSAKSRSRKRATVKANAEVTPGPLPSNGSILIQLNDSAKFCHELEQLLAGHATPELETIMKLHRLVILKLSAQAEAQPELWDLLKDLMKPVMDWARLQEQRKERELSEQKYQDQVEAKKAEETKPARSEDESLSPPTQEKIEFELKLL